MIHINVIYIQLALAFIAGALFKWGIAEDCPEVLLPIFMLAGLGWIIGRLVT